MSKEKFVKVRLLSDNGYCGAERVEFPVEAMARRFKDGFKVSEKELTRVGFDFDDPDPDYELHFFASEVEVVSSEVIETRSKKQPKHRPSVSNENYDYVMAFDGKTFNEKLYLILKAKSKSDAELRLANLRNKGLDNKLKNAKSEAAYSDNRLQAASKEITLLKCDKTALGAKLLSAEEHVIELNKELDCLRERLEAERVKCKELSQKHAHASAFYSSECANHLITKNKFTEAYHNSNHHKARAARYKFTTVIYGLCAIGFLIGWIYG